MRPITDAQAWIHVLAAAVLLAIIPACDGMLPGAMAPSAEVQALGQKAAAPLSALDTAIRAAGDAVVDSGHPGTTSSTSTGSGVFFQTDVNVTVNLGVTDPSGQPRYLGASGLINVMAQGVVSGSSGIGTASYSVVVTAVTDIVFMDSNSGDSGTILTGAFWTFSLQINWSFMDPGNWTLASVSDSVLSNLAVQVHHQAEVLTASIGGNRHLSVQYSDMAGMISSSLAVSADWSVTWSDATGAHTVLIHVAGQDQITLTIDGAVFGPYTRAQLQAVFHFQIE